MNRLLLWSAGLIAVTSLVFCRRLGNHETPSIEISIDGVCSGYSRLWVAVIDSSGKDTVVFFDDSLASQDALPSLRPDTLPEGPIRVLMRGYARNGAKYPIYEEERLYDSQTRALIGDTIPLDECRGVSRPPRIISLSADSGVKAGDTLRLIARVEDPDGRITVLRWYLDGDSTAERSDSVDAGFLDAEIAWVYRVPGVRDVALEAEDNTGNRVRKTLPVTIRPEGRPVLVFPFRDTTLSIKDSLLVSAFVMDSDGVVASFAWKWGSQAGFPPAQPLDKAQDTLRLGLWFPYSGEFDIGMRVVDDGEKTTIDSVRVHVLLDAPIAEAGPDTIVAVGDTIRLHGLGRDGLGRIMGYAWSVAGSGFVATGSGDTAFAAPLDSGAWPCIFRIADDDGLYGFDTLTLRTVYSSNDFLATLSPSNGVLVPDFDRNHVEYALAVPYADSTLLLSLRTEDAQARLTVAGKTLPPGDTAVQVPLQVGSNPLAIVVRAQDGRAGRTYALNASRDRNRDASLKRLEANPAPLSPAFDPEILFYQVALRNDQDVLTLTPVAADEANARIRIQGVEAESGVSSGPMAVPVGRDTVRIEVTAQNDSVVRLYRVAVTRLPSADAGLKALVLNAPGSGSLSPAFTETTHAYAVDFGNSVTWMQLKPTAGPEAVVQVDGRIVAPGAFSDTLPLAVGDNDIGIRIIAGNGDTATYAVRAHRRSADANLRSLALSAGNLHPPFSPEDTLYADTVLAESLTVTALADPSAGMVQVVLDSPRVAGTSPLRLALSEGDQILRVHVTAEDGNVRTYRVLVRRLNRDTGLAGLETDKGSLTPPFSAAGREYSIVVGHSDSMMAFKAKPSSALARLELDGVPLAPDAFSASRPLAVGDARFRLKVTAESGDTGIYGVTVHRKSADADLRSLRVGNGNMHPAFDPGTISYRDTVDNGFATITAIASDPGVRFISVGIDTFHTDSVVVPVPLDIGDNEVPISVGSEDGAVKIYTLAIHRNIVCGDGSIDGDEHCDGDNTGGVTCKDLEKLDGVLRCNGTCDGYDQSGCIECRTCIDCGGQACIDGHCGACRTSADCCAPLICFAGTCTLF